MRLRLPSPRLAPPITLNFKHTIRLSTALEHPKRRRHDALQRQVVEGEDTAGLARVGEGERALARRLHGRGAGDDKSPALLLACTGGLEGVVFDECVALEHDMLALALALVDSQARLAWFCRRFVAVAVRAWTVWYRRER